MAQKFKIDSTMSEKLLLILVVLIVILAGGVWRLSNNLAETKTSVTNLQAKLQADIDRNSIGDIGDSQMLSAERVVVNPIESKVYLPEFRIRLPYNDTTKTIAYSLRAAMTGKPRTFSDPLEADVLSTSYSNSNLADTRVNCANFVRLKLEAKPNPYSPHEKPFSVTLTDGRTLQVYESVNEPTCAVSWQQSVTPAALAAEFKKAEVY